MSYEFLTLEIDSIGVATVSLNRPEIHNAFNEKLIAEITQAFKELSNDDKARLVVLTGVGKSFCAGADLNWMSSMVNYSMEENIADSKKLALMFETINECPLPVIGKINGHALGGGVGVVAVCDYALTHEKAKFGFTEARLGLIPAVISPYCVNKIGETHARAWFMSGEMFQGPKALEMGLVHECVALEQFEERFQELKTSFLKAGPEAARASKKLIKDIMSKPKSELMDFTCEAIAKKRISSEGQEGMKALLNKEKPSWM